MIKVTMSNVTKMSEDALYIALGSLRESDAMYAVIDSELDRRLIMEQRSLKLRQELQLQKLRTTQDVQTEMAKIFSGFKGVKTLLLIERVGADLMDDYVVDEVTFTIYSKCEKAFPDNSSSWECETLEQANRKVARLLYYRIYNKFMREATVDSLAFLRKALE